MKNFTYVHQPDDKSGELRMVTRSLLLLSLLTAILYTRVFVVTMLTGPETVDRGGDGLLPFLFLVTAIVGLLLAWRWEGLGGLVMTLSGIGLAVLTFISATETPGLIAFFYGSPFIITGCLSLLCWWRKS